MLELVSAIFCKGCCSSCGSTCICISTLDLILLSILSYEPIQGLVKGPAEFLEGIESGTSSLARGVITGLVRGAARYVVVNVMLPFDEVCFFGSPRDALRETKE